jgi:tetratricopeptide (TPR) repeat protein
LDKLKQILNSARDLPEYVKLLDAESNKSGEDSPIVRKAIGQVFENKREFQSAIVQLELAAQLQPNDKDVYQSLIKCYDATGNRTEGTRQLLKLVDLDSHDLKLYEQLAERMKNQPVEAERAVTSLVEAAPTESESHAALAEIRQRQDRWPEAIAEWTQVAQIRSLEPTGLLKLAAAQVHVRDWDGARQSIQKLQRTEWPARFGNVLGEIRQLQDKLPN